MPVRAMEKKKEVSVPVSSTRIRPQTDMTGGPPISGAFPSINRMLSRVSFLTGFEFGKSNEMEQ